VKSSRPLQLIIVGIVTLAAVFILLVKEQPQAAAPSVGSSGALPEAQLDRALKASQPALAFFHSNSCEQCIIMIDTVKQVYPEFSSSVALVDVNVYDPENEALLRAARIQFIPTLVFYNQEGQAEMHVGVMDPDALRARLSRLSEEQ
jgi:thiol:disulfide interchange protein